MSSRKLMCLAVAAAAVMPSVAWAHAGAAAVSSFWSGVGHPFSGLDHLLAMVAVGIWAAQGGGRRVWAMPLAFIVLMLAAGLGGWVGLPLPYVEHGIAASLLVLGLLIASACRLDVLAGAVIVGFFAIFHGHAHGAEIPLASGMLAYSAGFALATALLHGLGAGGTILVRGQLARLAGMVIALSGVYFAVA
jgi:urease accessory protein